MSISIHHRIRMLIEETNDAFYGSDGHMNADYAEFASLALSEFKHVLRNPRLTRGQLTAMLRTGMLKHKDIDPESNWSSFMAHYITRSSNRNSKLLQSLEQQPRPEQSAFSDAQEAV